MAQVTCSVDDFTIGQGEKKTISLNLTNGDTKFCACQFDIQFPAGITVEYDEEEEEYIASLTDDRKGSDHSLKMSKVGDNAYRAVVMSMGNKSFKGTEGALVNISIVAAADAAKGEFEGNIADAKFTPKSGTSVTFDKVPFKVTIGDATAIKTVKAGLDSNAPAYNLAGQKVNSGFKGVVIQNGKKMVK
jgi:hypothetical protein